MRPFPKKIFFLTSIAMSLLFLFSRKSPSLDQSETCAFCDPEIISQQAFYEDERVIALYTHKPIFPGHCLVIPKRHAPYFSELTPEEREQMMGTIQKVHLAMQKVYPSSAYLLLQKNGVEAGQTVPHVHFHYIPCSQNKGSIVGFALHMYLANWKRPIPKTRMQQIVDTLEQEMLSIR